MKKQEILDKIKQAEWEISCVEEKISECVGRLDFYNTHLLYIKNDISELIRDFENEIMEDFKND